MAYLFILGRRNQFRMSIVASAILAGASIIVYHIIDHELEKDYSGEETNIELHRIVMNLGNTGSNLLAPLFVLIIAILMFRF